MKLHRCVVQINIWLSLKMEVVWTIALVIGSKGVGKGPLVPHLMPWPIFVLSCASLSNSSSHSLPLKHSCYYFQLICLSICLSYLPADRFCHSD